MGLTAAGGKIVALASIAFVVGTAIPAYSQTLEQALTSAYTSNPTLNSQRAGTRATDEYVPIALSGYRPQVFGSAYVGMQWAESRVTATALNGSSVNVISNQKTYPSGVGITIAQTIYDGLKTANSVRSAESQVKGQRELLRNTEQLVLLDAATAYMNVLQNGALVELQRQILQALRSRFSFQRCCHHCQEKKRKMTLYKIAFFGSISGNGQDK